jgi:hypothetical protein
MTSRQISYSRSQIALTQDRGSWAFTLSPFWYAQLIVSMLFAILFILTWST